MTEHADPTRTGHTFTGWFTDADATAAFDFAAPITGDLTLYAGWAINTYTVAFDSTGGSAVEAAAAAYDTTVSEPAGPTRTGYAFTGWYTDTATTTAYDFTTPVTADFTLYAGWSINTYSVAFDAAGGSAVEAVTVEYGSPVAEPADPTRTGYTFTGWFTDVDASTAYDFTTPVIGDLTLYAGWSINTYSVEFDSTGGSAVEAAFVNYDTPVAEPADPTRTGHTFTGWFTDADATIAYDFTTPITSDLTLYAGWSINSVPAPAPADPAVSGSGSLPVTGSQIDTSVVLAALLAITGGIGLLLLRARRLSRIGSI